MGAPTWTTDRDATDAPDRPSPYLEHLAEAGVLGEVEDVWAQEEAGTVECDSAPLQDVLDEAKRRIKR